MLGQLDNAIFFKKLSSYTFQRSLMLLQATLIYYLALCKFNHWT